MISQSVKRFVKSCLGVVNCTATRRMTGTDFDMTPTPSVRTSLHFRP